MTPRDAAVNVLVIAGLVALVAAGWLVGPALGLALAGLALLTLGFLVGLPERRRR